MAESVIKQLYYIMKNEKKKNGIEVVVPFGEWPRKKTFRLSERQVGKLKEIMTDYAFATENEAIGYVLETFRETVLTLQLANKKNKELEHDIDEGREKLRRFWEVFGGLKDF